MGRWGATLGAVVMSAAQGLGCGPSEPPRSLEEIAAAKCPRVHLDRMDTDWMLATGDPSTRIRLEKDGDGYRAWYVDGRFGHHALEGQRREKDVRLLEVLDAAATARFEAGERERDILYVQPSYRDCALQVFTGRIRAGVEDIDPDPREFLVLPETDDVWTWLPPTEHLFLGDAATNRARARSQVARHGGPKKDVERGVIPVGTWSEVSADAPDDDVEGCTYEMDLYLDDRLVPELRNLPAGDARGGWRPWLHKWELTMSGRHHLQMYRYRVCGGERERLGIAHVEAVLF